MIDAFLEAVLFRRNVLDFFWIYFCLEIKCLKPLKPFFFVRLLVLEVRCLVSWQKIQDSKEMRFITEKLRVIIVLNPVAKCSEASKRDAAFEG